MADAIALHSLPLFVRMAGRPVILLGRGEAADAKRRLLDRAGALVVGEAADARLAIVAIEDAGEAEAAVARLRARGVLVNAVDRPALCDFTLPAIVDRAPVLVAIGTGGVSAGLAAALRQRLEALLPAGLGRLAERLQAGRAELRERWPDSADRRRAIARMLGEGGPLDLLSEHHGHPSGLGEAEAAFRAQPDDARLGRASSGAQEEGTGGGVLTFSLGSPDPDDLTLRQARALANADRVVHDLDVPAAILDRARADAERVPAPAGPAAGLTVVVRMA